MKKKYKIFSMVNTIANQIAIPAVSNDEDNDRFIFEMFKSFEF